MTLPWSTTGREERGRRREGGREDEVEVLEERLALKRAVTRVEEEEEGGREEGWCALVSSVKALARDSTYSSLRVRRQGNSSAAVNNFNSELLLLLLPLLLLPSPDTEAGKYLKYSWASLCKISPYR